MNFFSPNSHPIFLTTVGPPVDPCLEPVYPSQIKTFDVYYTYEPIVGFEVAGYDCAMAPISLQVVCE